MSELINLFLKKKDILKQYKKYESIIITVLFILFIANIFTGFLQDIPFLSMYYNAIENSILKNKFIYDISLIALALIDLSAAVILFYSYFYAISDYFKKKQRDIKREITAEKYLYYSFTIISVSFIIQGFYLSTFIRTYIKFEHIADMPLFSINTFLLSSSLISTLCAFFMLLLIIINGGEDVDE